MKNIILYPFVEPSSSVKPRYTLAHKPSLCNECEFENENVRPIVTIGKAVFFTEEIEDDFISMFISDPHSVSCQTH